MEPHIQTQPISREDAMPAKNTQHKNALEQFSRFVFATLMVILTTFNAPIAGAATNQTGFSTPEAAMKALVKALNAKDHAALLAVLGPEAEDLVASGDPVRDNQDRERFLAAYAKKHALHQSGEKRILVIGEKDWPFPMPIMKKGGKWFFDAGEGREEILNRRVGENENNTIQTLLAIVDAQREYARTDRDGNGLLEYAQAFKSSPGRHDGLYWETKATEAPSPLGALLAEAQGMGYGGKQAGRTPLPYHGYYFRIIKSQGDHAKGGAYDYVVNGRMIGGFAVVAYPARHGNSGVMTFIVNHDGVVYQKDWGSCTEQTGPLISVFDPDGSWSKVE